jgi:hypothetical protein
MRLLLSLLCLLLTTALWPQSLVAQQQELFLITADSLGSDYDSIRLPDQWKYRAGDDSLFADATYDDADWPRADTRLQADQPETTEWKGIGLFRLPFRVDSSMVDIPLGIRLVHFGAANVYLDGELLYSSGIVGATAAEAEESKQRTYFLFLISRSGSPCAGGALCEPQSLPLPAYWLDEWVPRFHLARCQRNLPGSH